MCIRDSSKSADIFFIDIFIFVFVFNINKMCNMKDFLLIFRLNKDSEIKPSPEQVKERMEWFSNLMKQNKVSDKGNTLSPTGAKTIHSDGSIANSAHSEGKEIVTGYVVINAETIEEAVELAKANPIFKIGGSVEVREVAKFIKGND